MLKRSFRGYFPSFTVVFVAKTADQKIGLIKNKELINYSELSTRFGQIYVVLKIKINFSVTTIFYFRAPDGKYTLWWCFLDQQKSYLRVGATAGLIRTSTLRIILEMR